MATLGTVTGDPPVAMRLLAHPLRWELLQQLVRSDRTVAELTRLVDERQSLVSYHLRELLDGELVTKRRSAADARDSYYAVDLQRCRSQLRASADALHPGLWPAPVERPPRPRRRPRVLYLCTGNSARSQMAEGLTEHLSDGRVVAQSAGSAPKPLHPSAVAVMQRRGIDISGKRSKHLDELTSERFDVVVTLCDRVREVCPELPCGPTRVHWSMSDPSTEGSTRRERDAAFERTATYVESRVGFLLDTLSHSPAGGRSTTHVRRHDGHVR